MILTGWGVGERYWGGYSQKAAAKAEWLVAMPQGLDAHKAMIIGTAGLTAMLCVMTLEDAGVTPDQGPVLVTGASGGVGRSQVSNTSLVRLGGNVGLMSGLQSRVHDPVTSLGRVMNHFFASCDRNGVRGSKASRQGLSQNAPVILPG